MTRHRFLMMILIVVILSAGCDLLPGDPPSTLIPEDKLPTVIELTAQALVDGGLVTPPPSLTLSPEQLTATAAPISTATITPTPSITPSPTFEVDLGTPLPLTLPDPLPQAEIQIISPGRLSRVRSPLLLHVFLTPAQSEKELDLEYQVTMYTEDGSILIKQEINQDENNEVDPHQVLEIEFDIPRTAQSTRLEISSRDKFGRLTAITTTDLVLLSRGEEEIKAIQDLYASLLVQQPIPSTLIQGDVLVIQGVTRFSADDQLIVELVNRDGGQVGSGTVTISEETLGLGYRSFEGEIPFQVGTTSWIQVQVYARDGNFSGVQYLTSVEVLVSP